MKWQKIWMLYWCLMSVQKVWTTQRTDTVYKPGQSVGIFIGPEGGFDPDEIVLACETGGQVITLGRRILRTETAGLALLSVLMFQLEQVTY